MIMSSSGVRVMYAMKPICELSEITDLPTCMYKMTPIYSNKKEMSKEGDNEQLKQLEEKQDRILQRLTDLKVQVEKMKQTLLTPNKTFALTTSEMPFSKTALLSFIQDIVVSAHPVHPPLSLWVLRHLLRKQMKVALTGYVHSTVVSPLPSYLQSVEMDEIYGLRTSYNLVITLIWKEGKKDPVMMVSPVFQSAVEGEVNIARYLGRLMEPSYDHGDPVSVTLIDHWLEVTHSSVIHGNSKEKQAALKAMNCTLGKSEFLAASDSFTIADIVMWSALVQTKLHHDLPSNVKRWWKTLNDMPIFALPPGFDA